VKISQTLSTGCKSEIQHVFVTVSTATPLQSGFLHLTPFFFLTNNTLVWKLMVFLICHIKH